MEKKEITRKELYDLVWSQSIASLIKKYALSNNGFKELCKQYNIPMPPNGYWSKLKFNKQVVVEGFSTDFIGKDKIELPIRQEGILLNSDSSPWTILTHEIQNDRKAPVNVPEKLTNSDVMTMNTKEYWKNWRNKSYVNDKTKISLPIYREIVNQKRALLLMDTFVKLLRYRGHSFKNRNHETYIVIGDVEIPFSLREATKRMPSTQKYYNYDYVPTDIMVLKTGQYSGVREWRDRKLKLEFQLAKIVAKLEIEAAEESIRLEQARIWRKKYDEERRIEKEQEKHRAREKVKLNQLLELSENHHKAAQIRAFVKAVESNSKKKNIQNPEIISWIKWANEQADWYDPIANNTSFFNNDIIVEEDL